jgi:aryl-alcohol dehydrogenase-like predicted oxidoreductase
MRAVVVDIVGCAGLARGSAAPVHGRRELRFFPKLVTHKPKSMLYSTLGNTGLIVSRLSFGAMTFTSGNKGFPTIYKTEASDANTMVGRALNAGINFFDTADGYAGGESEASERSVSKRSVPEPCVPELREGYEQERRGTKPFEVLSKERCSDEVLRDEALTKFVAQVALAWLLAKKAVQTVKTALNRP